jgi:hypothetical protein
LVSKLYFVQIIIIKASSSMLKRIHCFKVVSLFSAWSCLFLSIMMPNQLSIMKPSCYQSWKWTCYQTWNQPQ